MRNNAGLEPDDALLKDIKTYAVFPKNEQWIQQALRKILQAKKTGKAP